MVTLHFSILFPSLQLLDLLKLKKNETKAMEFALWNEDTFCNMAQIFTGSEVCKGYDIFILAS